MDPNENTNRLPETDKVHSVPSNDNAQADLDLQDDKDQALQDAYSDETASEAVGMPQEELKEGLDALDPDKHKQGDSPATDGSADDWREHIEDMNEGDKDH